MTFTPEQKAELERPLNAKHIVKPTGQFGAKGDYIEGWHAIAEANRIFGHDGWSYSIQLIQDSLNLAEDSRGNPQWQAAYTCICSLRAGGVERQDVGFGSGFAKNVGDAIEGATKEAVTDSLKRALRTFGHPFGLALYDKSRSHVEEERPPTISDDDRLQVMALAPAADVSIQTICEGYGISDLRELPASKLPALIKRLRAQPQGRKAA